MFESPTLKGGLAKTREITRTHSVRKQSSTGDKGEFEKSIKEKLEGEQGSRDSYKQKSGKDKVVLFEYEEEETQEKVHKKNKAKGDSPGPAGHAVDIKA